MRELAQQRIFEYNMLLQWEYDPFSIGYHTA